MTYLSSFAFNLQRNSQLEGFYVLPQHGLVPADPLVTGDFLLTLKTQFNSRPLETPFLGLLSKGRIFLLGSPLTFLTHVNYYHLFYMFICSHVCFPYHTKSNSKSWITSSSVLLYKEICWMHERTIRYFNSYLCTKVEFGCLCEAIYGEAEMLVTFVVLPVYWHHPHLPWDSITPLQNY